MACLALATIAGCATSTRESEEALAERYAREESRLIDEKAFAQARERSRVQRDARRRLGTERIDAAAPLDIDPDIVDRWQFGTLAHPRLGTPVCAAVSGHGLDTAAPAPASPRLVILADGGHVTSTTPLVTDRTDSSVRVDGGLPIALAFADDGRSARLALAPAVLLDRLRDGAVAILDVAITATPSVAAGATNGRTAVAPDTDLPADGAIAPTAPPAGGPRAFERVIELDGLGPMLDEIARCATLPPAVDPTADAPPGGTDRTLRLDGGRSRPSALP